MKGVLVVVSCGKRKIWDKDPDRGPTPARDAYIGAPFKVSKEYAEHFAERWVILSAKYGFIAPDFEIPGPYDVSFSNPSTRPVAVSVLTNQIAQEGLDRFKIIVGLGGRCYREAIEAAYRSKSARLCFPFAGLPIGKAMQAAKRAIALDDPCAQRGSGR